MEMLLHFDSVSHSWCQTVAIFEYFPKQKQRENLCVSCNDHGVLNSDCKNREKGNIAAPNPSQETHSQRPEQLPFSQRHHDDPMKQERVFGLTSAVTLTNDPLIPSVSQGILYTHSVSIKHTHTHRLHQTHTFLHRATHTHTHGSLYMLIGWTSPLTNSSLMSLFRMVD